MCMMDANPYLILNAQHGRRTTARRKQDKYHATRKKKHREGEKQRLLKDAKAAEYKRLHCHEIVLHSDSAGVSLTASVWIEDVLEQRRNIIRHFNKNAEDDDGSDDMAGGCEGVEECHTYVSDPEEIEALIQDKDKFLEYCKILTPGYVDDSNTFEEVLQRYIEAREILVELEIKNCCQGTAKHATLLENIEAYCRDEYAHDPDKMLVTIVGSKVQYKMDAKYEDFNPVQARQYTHADETTDNLKNMNEFYRRREMHQFYQDHGYRILPWEQTTSDRNGHADGTVCVYSKHLSNPILDKDEEPFIEF